jgi:transcription antitermination protein NusB
MGRRASRELAMKLLYQLEIQKEDREQQKNRFFEDNTLAEKDKVYINDVVGGVFGNQGTIDNMIEANAKGWKMGRISKVDLSIMRLSIYEICFRNDIPLNVSINEAVELAKKYSNEDAGSFVNGILSKIHKEKIEAEEHIDGG